MSNLLIVESENDQCFIEALISHLNIDIKVESPICSIDEYECLGGMSKLKNKFEMLKSRLQKGDDINKLGIIFDADDVGIEARTLEIQEKYDEIFTRVPAWEFKIFIMNIDGSGELETLLKEIKSKESPMADCLDSWQECNKENKINQKEFDKFWIQIYQRYDCCTPSDKKQAGRKCNNKASFKKGIYDFNNSIDALTNLKAFLKELGS